MKKMVIVSLVLLLAAIPAMAVDVDEFSKYLWQNVTVNSCNVTAFEGQMIEWWPDSIVVQEKCNPEIGAVTIKKSCIIWIHPGYECLLS